MQHALDDNTPHITVVVAVLNGANTIEECVESVLTQTYKHRELIVIDGGSTDKTTAVLQRYEKQIAYCNSARDKGISDAWNRAMPRVRGEWILFLGADDILAASTTMESVRDALVTNAEADVVFGKVRFSSGRWKNQVFGHPWQWREFRRGMSIPHQAAFHNRRLFREVGCYDSTLRIAADYEFLLRRGCALSAQYVDLEVAITGGDGLSSRHAEQALSEFRRAQLRHKVAHKGVVMVWYWDRKLRKWLFDRVAKNAARN